MMLCILKALWVCLNCSYLNIEIVKRHRQCKVNIDFYKIGIEYEGSRMEIREVGSMIILLLSVHD